DGEHALAGLGGPLGHAEVPDLLRAGRDERDVARPVELDRRRRTAPDERDEAAQALEVYRQLGGRAGDEGDASAGAVVAREVGVLVGRQHELDRAIADRLRRV